MRDAINCFHKENPDDAALNKFAQIGSGDKHYNLETDSIIDKYIENPVDLEFKEYMPYQIAEIILGSKCKLDDHDLRLFLIKNVIDLNLLKKSQTLYR